jgi:hypothetical protein
MVSRSFEIRYCSVSDRWVGIRVMWLKSRARAHRWKEEIQLVREEMERVKKFFEWEEEWWKSQANGRQPTVLIGETAVSDVMLAEGLEAYANRQADLRHRLRNHFGYLWRDVASWIEKGEVPQERNWFSRLRPEDSPYLYRY